MVTVKDRFYAKVDRDGPLMPGMDTPCWRWIGGVDACGYGRFWIEGKVQIASRVAWLIERGEIPAGMEVCHRCDNGNCPRFDHLFLGTHAENMSDMRAKGRMFKVADVPKASGDRNGARTHPQKMIRSGLSEFDVLDIRRRFIDGERQKDLAAEYGIKQSAMSSLVHGHSWSHLPGAT